MTDQTGHEANEPLEVVAVSGPTEAQMIEELLNKNGIECSLQGNVPSSPLPVTSDLDEVRILVKQSDAEQANELVTGYFTPVGKDELLDGEPSLGVDDPDEPGGFQI
jgi:hypothetical protein